MRVHAVLIRLAALAVVSSAAGAADYTLDPVGSSLTFTAIQQDAKFESRFGTFTADVHSDPASPESGHGHASGQ